MKRFKSILIISTFIKDFTINHFTTEKINAIIDKQYNLIAPYVNKLIIFLLFSVSVFAQGKKDIRKNGVKTLSEMVINYQDGNEITHQDSYQKFDKNGNIVDETEFDKAGKIKKRIVTKYDNLGDKLEETTLGENGKQIERLAYKYNSDSEKTEEWLYNDKNELTQKSIYTFNNKGLRTEKKTYDAKGQLIQLKKYIYEY